MTDNRNGCGGNSSNRNETVCIDTERVLDSCRDRDCFENVRVYLTDIGNDIIDRTSGIRTKSAEIAWTYIGIDPVPFNCGFYTVTIRFYIKVCLEACIGNGRSQEFEGICVVEKRVVLFGGESAVSVFRSNADSGEFCGMPEPCTQCSSVPTAVVEAVAPVVLGTKIVESPQECNCCCCCCRNEVPERISSCFNGTLDFDDNARGKYLTISLGIFSVVRIVRPAQYLIHATEYNVPDKQCMETKDDDPCGVFRTMPFPTGAFNAGHAGTYGRSDHGNGGRCGCGS